MEKQIFTGKSLDDALSQAAKMLNTEKGLLSYNLLPTSKEGGLFSKLFQRSVRLEAWVEQDKQDLEEAARRAVLSAIEKKPRPQKPKTEQQPRNVVPVSEEKRQTEKLPGLPGLDFSHPQAMHLLNEFSQTFATGFGISKEQVQFSVTETKDVNVFLNDAYVEQLLEKTDRLSLAFEHVFKRIAQRTVGDISARVALDSGNARERRAEKLRKMAHEMAEKVRKTGKTLTLSAKSPQERRVIHMSLDGAEGVATRSVGTGENRRLVIYSTLSQHRTRSAKGRSQSSGNKTLKAAAATQESHGSQPPSSAEKKTSKNWKRRKKQAKPKEASARPGNAEAAPETREHLPASIASEAQR